MSEAMMHMWGVRKSFRRMMRMARTANATSCRLWYTSWGGGGKFTHSQSSQLTEEITKKIGK